MSEARRMVGDFVGRRPLAFTVPGHGGGAGADPDIRRFLGRRAFAADVTQTADVDDLMASRGVFRRAQADAARLWNADATWFLTGGSSAGVMAMMTAALGPGDTVLLPRGAHISAVWGLVASGAMPRFWPLRWNVEVQSPDPPRPEDVASSIEGVAAVLVVSPTYFGTCCPLRELVAACHSFDRAVMVDEAWGAHLGFHPAFPESSMQAGADLATSSVHKKLAGLSGTAVLHLQGSRVDRSRVHGAVMSVTTTSPYYGALLSLEACVRSMQERGAAVLERVRAVAGRMRAGLSRISGVRVFSPDGYAADPAHVAFEVTGWSGYQVEERLWEDGIAVEMATSRHVLLVVGPSHGMAAATRLLRAVRRLTPRVDGPPDVDAWLVDAPRFSMTPRQAWYAPRRAVPVAQAAGRTAAEPVCVYPPGIPAIIPGGIVTADALDQIRRCLDRQGRLLGPADPDLETLQTVA